MNTRTRGFTLLELMVVLVIAGLLLGIGVPAMRDFIRNSRITAAANDLIAALYLARTEAIKRRMPVTLCALPAPLAASPVCAASADLTGWIVFVDNNGSRQWESPEEILIRREPLPSSITGRGSANPLRVTYQANGFMQNAAAGRIVLCDERGNVPAAGELSAARGITVSVTGRPNVTRDKAEIQALIALLGGSIGGCS